MSVDYPGAIDMGLPSSYEFNFDVPLYIVVHETGGDETLDAVHNTFLATMRSTHFAVGLDGAVAQFVPLNRGAGGNCCPDTYSDGTLDCDPLWVPLYNKYGNLNLCTISIEHCNNLTNTLPMPQAQVDASNKLIAFLLKWAGLPMDISHVKGHNTINPRSKPNCPGTFDFNQLANFLKGTGTVNNTPTPAQQKQFDTTWDSHYKDLQQKLPYVTPPITIPRKGTGIYEVYIQAHLQGHELGACTSEEYPNNDWNDTGIICQNFEGAIIQWPAKRIFTANGEIQLS